MEKEVLLVERRGEHGEVAILTTNRPEAHNRNNYLVYERSWAIYEELAQDPYLRVVVVTGVGDYFCTGGQVNAADPIEKARYQVAVDRYLKAKTLLEVPVIAAVNGECMAGGMNTLMGADLAIAVDTATFGYPEIQRGGFPATAMVTAMDYMPSKLLLQYFYSGDLFGAEEALAMNLVNEVVSAEAFWPTVEKYVQMILTKPAPLIKIGKKAYAGMRKLPSSERSAYAKAVLKEVLDEQAEHQKTAGKTL